MLKAQGELDWTFSPDITIKIEDGVIFIDRPSDEPTLRALAWYNPGFDQQYGDRR